MSGTADATVVDGRTVGVEYGPQGLKPDRPTILLIHGSGGSRLSWQAQKRALDREVNVIIVELPGHGQTSGPPLDSVSDLAAWLVRVMSALPLDAPPVMAGISLGGAVVQELALTRPDLVHGLVLISTGPRLNLGGSLLERLRQNHMDTVRGFVEAVFGRDANPRLREQSLDLIAALPVEVLEADFKAGRGFDRSRDIAWIKSPTLVICGAEDRVTPPELSRFLAERIPGATLRIIDRAGHMAALERFDLVNRAILDFVRSLPHTVHP